MIRFMLSVTLLFSLVACEREATVLPESPLAIASVDESLQPYFSAFEEAAAARGFSVDLAEAGIEATIQLINEENVAGQCTYHPARPNEIVIDAEYWQRASTLGQEFVVFHELGHCYLSRDHLDHANSAGVCISMMASGLGDCRNAYSHMTRESYLDELFFGG